LIHMASLATLWSFPRRVQRAFRGGLEWRHESAFPRRKSVRVPHRHVPPEVRGRRECRVFSCTRSLVCDWEKHTSLIHYRRSRNIDIPCATVLTAYIVRAPARLAFVSPSLAHHRGTSLAPATRAPGPHAFAVRIHAARLTASTRPSHPALHVW
jgi:hypothetical protein